MGFSLQCSGCQGPPTHWPPDLMRLVGKELCLYCTNAVVLSNNCQRCKVHVMMKMVVKEGQNIMPWIPISDLAVLSTSLLRLGKLFFNGVTNNNFEKVFNVFST